MGGILGKAVKKAFSEENWLLSSYNEDTPEQLDYYIRECACEVGDVAFLYKKEDDSLTEMEILHIICRSDDVARYDKCDEDVLLDGEDDYNADTSAEFISDNDSYLVWFRYV